MTKPGIDILFQESLELLKKLVSIPSFSGEENGTAEVLANFFGEHGIRVKRKGNNIWVRNRYFDPGKPTILLNSHHDTVKPVASWTKDPFSSEIISGKLYGLGSNDAGASVTAQAAAFLNFFTDENLGSNLIYSATAEEEVSGRNGVETILEDIAPVSLGIVGEPTKMDLAIAERGLLVIDCEAVGTSGHAAREEGDNAIYKAITDINWFRTYRFPRESELLGPVKMNVTIISAGSQHNVIPGSCRFTVDIRLNELYTHEEILEVISRHVKSAVHPRSVRLKPSFIPPSHPIVKAGLELGRKVYGSPTSSDQALMNFPTVKVGPGDSARSHTADEFIKLDELKEGIEIYIALLKRVLSPVKKNKAHETLAETI